MLRPNASPPAYLGSNHVCCNHFLYDFACNSVIASTDPGVISCRKWMHRKLPPFGLIRSFALFYDFTLQHKFVPWILVNNASFQSQQYLQNDLPTLICQVHFSLILSLDCKIYFYSPMSAIQKLANARLSSKRQVNGMKKMRRNNFLTFH